MRYIQFFLLTSLLAFAQLLSAQVGEKTYEITITTTDKNGNKEVKELLIEGEDLSQEDIDELIQEELGGNDYTDVNVNVNVSQVGEADGDAKTITKIIKQRSNISDDNRVIIEDKEMEIEVIDDRVYINGEEVEEGDFGDKQVRIMKFEEGDEVDIEELLEGEGIEIGEGERVYFIESEESESGVAFLGVTTRTTNNVGLLISSIVEGSSAEKAGLKKGDIILSVGGREVNSFSSLSKIVKSYIPGETVNVEYKRDEVTNDVDIVLSDYEKFANNEARWIHKRSRVSDADSKEDAFMRGEEFRGGKRGKRNHHGRKNWEELKNRAALGVHAKKVDDQLVIVQVREDSPAVKAGLQVGDVILKVDKADMLDAKQFYFTIIAHEIGDEVKLKISRDGKKQNVKATLEAMMPFTRKHKHNKSMRKERIIIKDKIEERRAERETRGALKIKNFDLSPNPSIGLLTVDFEMDALKSDEEFTLRIISLDGKVIREEVVSDFDGRLRKDYDLKDVGTGIYLFQVDKNKQKFTKRFVIKNN